MIEIFRVSPKNKGDLLATCSVKIKPWKLTIHKVAVFQKGMQRWVSLPRDRYEVNGETKYDDVMEFDDASVLKRFRDQIVEAVDAYIEQHGDMKPEDAIKEDEPFPW